MLDLGRIVVLSRKKNPVMSAPKKKEKSNYKPKWVNLESEKVIFISKFHSQG